MLSGLLSQPSAKVGLCTGLGMLEGVCSFTCAAFPLLSAPVVPAEVGADADAELFALTAAVVASESAVVADEGAGGGGRRLASSSSGARSRVSSFRLAGVTSLSRWADWAAVEANWEWVGAVGVC